MSLNVLSMDTFYNTLIYNAQELDVFMYDWGDHAH